METRAHRPGRAQRDDAHLWQVDAFGGVELLRAQFVRFSFAPHAHEEYMIVVSERGIGLPRFWRGEHQINPGDVFVLRPGAVHSGCTAGDALWRYRSFYVPTALMERVGRELSGSDRGIPHFAEEIVNDPVTAATLLQMHAALEEPDSALACESRVLGALASLVARHAVGTVAAPAIGSEHRAVTRAKEYLETLPGENVSLDALAHEAGIGPYHLCRVFRRETGLSPHAYQLNVRVRLAKALLMHGAPIARVAADAGFADQAHLTRHFKRMFGVTPGRYHAGSPSPAQ